MLCLQLPEFLSEGQECSHDTDIKCGSRTHKIHVYCANMERLRRPEEPFVSIKTYEVLRSFAHLCRDLVPNEAVTRQACCHDRITGHFAHGIGRRKQRAQQRVG